MRSTDAVELAAKTGTILPERSPLGDCFPETHSQLDRPFRFIGNPFGLFRLLENKYSQPRRMHKIVRINGLINCFVAV